MANTYIINKAGSPQVIAIDEGTLDTTSTSLTLTGKGRADYGQHRNRNLVALLENFAGASEPANPTLGQLWYRTDTQDLFLRTVGPGLGSPAAGSPQNPVWAEIGRSIEGSRFEVATVGSPTSFYQTTTINAVDPGDPTATNILVFVNGVHQAEGATGNFIYDYNLDRVNFNPGSPSVYPETGDTIVVQAFGVESGTAVGSPSGPSGVVSFEGRTGVVVSQLGDYSSSEVTNNSGVSGATVTAALNDLDTRIDLLGSPITGGSTATGNTAGGNQFGVGQSIGGTFRTPITVTGNVLSGPALKIDFPDAGYYRIEGSIPIRFTTTPSAPNAFAVELTKGPISAFGGGSPNPSYGSPALGSSPVGNMVWKLYEVGNNFTLRDMAYDTSLLGEVLLDPANNAGAGSPAYNTNAHVIEFSGIWDTGPLNANGTVPSAVLRISRNGGSGTVQVGGLAHMAATRLGDT